MSALEGLEAYVREKIEKEGMTHAKLSVHLREVYPGVNGFSVRSLERFCADKNIHRTSRPSADELDEAVRGAIAQVMNCLRILASNYLYRRFESFGLPCLCFRLDLPMVVRL